MPPGIGYSFQPGSQDTPLPPRGQGGQSTAPQQAIRTLSLRVPQTQSVQGLAPLPLLNARGGGGTDLDMLLKALLMAFGGGALPGAGGLRPGGGGGVPGGGVPPRITPIDPPRDFPTDGPLTPAPRPEIPRDFPTDGPLEPLPPFDIGRVPGGGIGNRGRPRGPLEPLF